MNLRTLQRYCSSLPGAAECLLPDPYNILVYGLAERDFAYFKTSEPERWRFSVKVSPERFLELTAQPGVKPARYRARQHWVTIVEVSKFPAEYLRELVRGSHEFARMKLPRARRPGAAG
ncbi:MAG: MmcQ/YjbR family DNA-binding protein [Betaproteobacteria bacterium]|nr:MmcQ/YjbR family DNA-binding protein [Betaproteobacteria bacterium]